MSFLTGKNIEYHSVVHVLCIALVSFTIGAFDCRADERDIFGLNFEVESLIESSSDVTELHVLGNTQVVPKSEVDLKIVSLFFNPSDTERTKIRVNEIPLNRLEQFTIQAAEAESSDIAASGLYALGVHSESNLESMRSIIDKIKTSKKSSIIFDAATTLVEKTNKFIAPLYAISIASCETTTRTNFQLPQDYEFKSKLYYYAAAETTRLLINQQIDSANNVLTCMKSTFNSKELNIINIERLSKNLPETIKEFEKTRDYIFPNTSELASGDLELEAALTDSLSTYLLAKSRKFIDQNDPGYALWLISRIPESKRNIETFDLTQKCIAKLEKNAEKAILAPGVSKYLFSISQTNPLFRAQYTKFLVQLTEYVLKEERPDRLQVIFGLLLALNPDPSEINDTVRLNLANYYINRGAKDMGLAVYAGLKGGLPLTKKISVWLKITWLKFPMTCIILISSSLLGLLFALLVLLRRAQNVVKLSRLHLGNTGSLDESTESEDTKDRPLFVNKGVSQNLSPITQEYASLISFFNLEPDCSVQDIKHAYREKMKILHPDMKSQAAKGTDAQEIMSTRKAYERLLQICKNNLVSNEEITVLKKRKEILTNHKNF
jgi:hypothetical protein